MVEDLAETPRPRRSPCAAPRCVIPIAFSQARPAKDDIDEVSIAGNSAELKKPGRLNFWLARTRLYLIPKYRPAQIEAARTNGHRLAGQYLEIRYEHLRASPELSRPGFFGSAEFPAMLTSSMSSLPRVAPARGAIVSDATGGGAWRTSWSRRLGEIFDHGAGALPRSLDYESDENCWRSLSAG